MKISSSLVLLSLVLGTLSLGSRQSQQKLLSQMDAINHDMQQQSLGEQYFQLNQDMGQLDDQDIKYPYQYNYKYHYLPKFSYNQQKVVTRLENLPKDKAKDGPEYT